MKSIKYNQTLAVSILIAAALFRENQSAELVVVDEDTDDNLIAKYKRDLDKPAKENYAISLAVEDSDRGNLFALGIISEHYDVSNFDSQLALSDVLAGDKIKVANIIAIGATIKKFLKSPAGKSSESPKPLAKIEEEVEEEETQTGSGEDSTTQPSTDTNEQKSSTPSKTEDTIEFPAPAPESSKTETAATKDATEPADITSVEKTTGQVTETGTADVDTNTEQPARNVTKRTAANKSKPEKTEVESEQELYQEKPVENPVEAEQREDSTSKS